MPECVFESVLKIFKSMPASMSESMPVSVSESKPVSVPVSVPVNIFKND